VVAEISCTSLTANSSTSSSSCRSHDEFATGWEKVKSGSVVSLKQFHGIDIVPFAVELAKLTLTIGKKLAIDEARASVDAAQMEMDLEHHFERALPLENLDDYVRCDDALFCEWPHADAIVSNPPYQSKNKMQQELGYEYVTKVRARYPDVPGRADYCVYWFRRAHDELEENGRAGLVGTNTIRQNYSREGGLDYIVEHGGEITEAVATQEWSGDAAVHVSIVNWIKGPYDGKRLLTVQNTEVAGKPWALYEVERINPALSPELDVTRALVLQINKSTKTCYQGQTHGHDAFLLTPKEAKAMLSDTDASECIHPYITGDEMLATTDGKPVRFVIDLNHCLDLPAAMAYKDPFSRLQRLALPDLTAKAEAEAEATGSDTGPRQSHLQRWWRFWRPRDEMVRKLEGLSRYMACARVTKRPIFAFLKSNVRPNDALQVFAFEDDYSFGILHSGIHWEWFIAKCSTLTGRFRYTSNSVFDTFPWPQSPKLKQARAVADAAKNLRAVRHELMRANAWSLRDLYRSIEAPGEHPLKNAQRELEDSVRAAYGMKKSDLTLPFLLGLNGAVARGETEKQRVIGPGLLALGGEFADAYDSFVSDDFIVG
jgi:hypothetical protein